MKIKTTPIQGLLIFEPNFFEDHRGFFYESFNSKEISKNIDGIKNFVQDNHSMSKKNVLRGLHFQTKFSQAKLVRAINGSVYDVAVDLRQNSKTFGSWYGLNISKSNRRQLFIPKNFAHGFLVTSKEAEIVYKVSDYYAPKYEKTLKWNDKDLNIKWPTKLKPILSEKDKLGISFKELLKKI